MTRVEVDRDMCVGSGSCVWIMPAVFAQGDEDGLVRLLAGAATPVPERLRQVAAECPSGAIRVED